MDTVTLYRENFQPDGTFGSLEYNGKEICLTCELPWHDNEPDKSCIPEGTYIVVPHNSPAHPHTWEITGVENRKNILFHNGNTELDSLGCVLVGDQFGTIGGYDAVLNSVATLAKLRTILPPTFKLIVESGTGSA